MPISYSFEHDDVDLYVHWQGAIRPCDIARYFRELTSKVTSFADMSVLIEIDRAVLRGIDYASVRQMSYLTKRRERALLGSRTAIVAKGPLAYGLARMYIALREPPYEFAVFRDHSRAMQWLRDRAA